MSPSEFIADSERQIASLRARLAAIHAGTSNEDLFEVAKELGRFNDGLCRFIVAEHTKEMARRKLARAEAEREFLRKMRERRARTRVVDQIKADLAPIFRPRPGPKEPGGR